jgi:acetolactate synthase small subunit
LTILKRKSPTIWKTSEKRMSRNTKHTEGYSSRLEQAEDRILELEDKMEIQGKTEELLLTQLKTCEGNMQELTDSMKRPNLRSWAMKKEKRCKQKEFVIYSTK